MDDKVKSIIEEESSVDKPEEKVEEEVEETKQATLQEDSEGDKPVDSVEEKAVDSVEDKPADSVEEKAGDSVEDKPADSVEEKPGNSVEDKTPKEKSKEKSEEKTEEKSEEKPAEKNKKAEDKIEEVKPFVDKAAFEKVKKKKHIVRWILVAVADLILIFYCIMTYLSYKYFAPGTRINGKDYSLKSYDEVVEDVNSKYDGYVLRIRYRNGDEVLTKDEAGLIATAEKDIKKIKKKQNPFLWFTYLWSDDNTVEFEFDCDKDVLMSSLEKSDFLDPDKMVNPEEPSLVFNDQTGHVEVVDGNPGTLLDKFSVFFLCYNAVKEMNSYLDIKNSDCYIKPKFSEESPRIVNTVRRINHYLDAKVTYLYGSVKINISAENIYNILEISDDYSVYLSKQKVRSFLEKLSKDYDTFGKTRIFKTHNGKFFKAVSEEYGYQIDVDKETDLLYMSIANGETVEREPEFIHKGYSYDKPQDDLGGNFVEVDLTNQMVYLHVDGDLVFESDCVTGCIREGHKTPSGIFDVDGLYHKVVLKGPDYESPVSYWMPFTSDIGFHDATWRGTFGGDIYINNGSHGCVNMPLGNAETMFYLIDPGFPVIMYWEEDLTR